MIEKNAGLQVFVILVALTLMIIIFAGCGAARLSAQTFGPKNGPPDIRCLQGAVCGDPERTIMAQFAITAAEIDEKTGEYVLPPEEGRTEIFTASVKAKPHQLIEGMFWDLWRLDEALCNLSSDKAYFYQIFARYCDDDIYEEKVEGEWMLWSNKKKP